MDFCISVKISNSTHMLKWPYPLQLPKHCLLKKYALLKKYHERSHKKKQYYY